MNYWRIGAWGLGGAAMAVTLLGFVDRLGLGRSGWLFDLLSHFPKHLFILGVIALALAGIGRTWRAAALAGAVTVINALLVLTLGDYALPQRVPAGASLVRVISANLHGSSSAFGELVKLANQYEADLIAIYEAPDELTLEDAARFFPDMRTVKLASQTPEGRKLIRRSVLLARSPNADGVSLATFPESYGVIMRTSLPVGGDTVRIVTVHPPSPASPDALGDRNSQLSHIKDELPVTSPYIVLGDFNATPWGRVYSWVPGMRAGDPRFDGTFPAFAGWFGLPIDHIKFGGGLILMDYHVGPDIGSDHRPLFATFALPEEAPAPAPPAPATIDHAPPPGD